MNRNFIQNIHAVHFIGIGGIGMSALARMMVHEGKKVTGTNDWESPSTLDGLRDQGVHIYIDRDISHISPDTDVIIYSTAWDQNEKDFMNQVRALSTPVLTYAEALGLASQGKYTIAISGTHGKTTTTAMIAEMLVTTKKDPTVIVGSLLKGSGSNFIAGESNLFVVEACEYQRSFLNLSPEILIITNIDNDHLDYYKDIEDIISAFHELAMKVPKHGFVVADLHDQNIQKALLGTVANIVDYSKVGETKHFDLSVPGDHNIKNAQAALAVAGILNITEDEALAALRNFQGTWRRMEYKGELSNGTKVYDDYAHHPTEIRASLQGFRAKHPEGRIRIVFQPHLYSRTKLLLNDFAGSFSDADEVIVAPIYAAREKSDLEISAEILTQEILKYHSSVRAGENLLSIESYLRDTVRAGDIIITMGAGDVNKIGEHLLP